MNNTQILLEKAVVFALYSDHQKIITLFPTLDKGLFIDSSLYGFLEIARNLIISGSFSEVVFVSELHDKNISPDPIGLLSQLAATSGSTYDWQKMYSAWLSDGKTRYIRALEARLISDGASYNDIISARKKITDDCDKLGNPHLGTSLSELIAMTIESVHKKFHSKGEGITPFGFRDIDNAVIGMMPSTMTVIASRPGCGKTSLACQLTLRAMFSGPVGFNTIEMSEEQLLIKIACMHNGVNNRRFLTPWKLDNEYDLKVLDGYLQSLNSLPIHIFRTRNPNMIEPFVAIHGIKTMFVDYIQLFTVPKAYSGKKHEFLTEVANDQADMARRKNIASIMLSQINREGESGATMSNLKGGGIEEAADTVLILERPDFAEGGSASLRTIANIAKARWGMPTSQELMINPVSNVFQEWDPRIAEEMIRNVTRSVSSGGDHYAQED